MITRDTAELRGAAEQLAASVRDAVGHVCQVRLLPGSSGVGGGAFPATELPTWLVGIRHGEIGPDVLAARLREAEIPVIARIEQGELLFDPRTLLLGEPELLVAALRGACLPDPGAGARPPRKEVDSDAGS